VGDRGERGGGEKFDRKECTKDGKGNNSLSLSLFSSFHEKTILSMDELEWNNTLSLVSPLHVIFPETKWRSCRIETNGGGGGGGGD